MLYFVKRLLSRLKLGIILEKKWLRIGVEKKNDLKKNWYSSIKKSGKNSVVTFWHKNLIWKYNFCFILRTWHFIHSQNTTISLEYVHFWPKILLIRTSLKSKLNNLTGVSTYQTLQTFLLLNSKLNPWSFQVKIEGIWSYSNSKLWQSNVYWTAYTSRKIWINSKSLNLTWRGKEW